MEASFINIIVAGALGLLVSLTYIFTSEERSVNFARTLIVLPMLVCVVITMVNGSLGTSVAILGAFGLVRFRSLQGNSRDICFIFFSMVTGLTCSVGYLAYAAAVTTLICIILIVLAKVKYGVQKVESKELKIMIPENLDYTTIFDDLFEKYTMQHSLCRVKTTNMGSLYELTYRVKGVKPEEEKSFLDDIRVRNGNLTVMCGRINREEEL